MTSRYQHAPGEPSTSATRSERSEQLNTGSRAAVLSQVDAPAVLDDVCDVTVRKLGQQRVCLRAALLSMIFWMLQG
jgi:hypothetical protein